MATNRNINYVAKDFDSIVDALITFATVNFGPDTAGNRQWTSFNVDDFSRTWLELVAYVGDLIFFYLDVQATQSNLQTATIRSAVLNIARQFGFVVATSSSASGLAKFTLSQAGTIPVGFKLAAENGAEFFVSSNSPAVGSTTLQPILTVTQGVERQESFVASGVQNEEIALLFLPIVVDTTNPISTLISPRVTVNGNSYTMVNTFVQSLPTDKHFRLLTNSDGQSIIRFGDGVFGVSLAPNDAIVIDYRTGGGTIGNIPANTLTTLVDVSTIITAVTNTDAFGGGSDEASIEQLRELIPNSLRTLERAVTINDFGDIITANFSNVSKAIAERNLSDIGTDVNIYVIPSGNTITPISSNLSLFNSISDFIDERKTVTTIFKILDAFGINIKFKLKAFLSSGASSSVVQSNIVSALEDFFDLNSGDLDGSGTKFGQQILLNDMYDLIDALEGIDRFEITKLHYSPRFETTTAIGTNYITSAVEVFPSSDRYEWLIGPEFIASSPEYVPFSVFQKIKAEVTSLSEDSLADSSLNLAVLEGTSSGVNVTGSNNIIFDFSKTFVVDEFVGGSSPITITNISGDTWDHSGSSFLPRLGDRIIDSSSNTSRVTSITDSDTFVLSSGVPNALVPGAATIRRDEFLFVDSAGNIWSINDNDAHSLTLSATAINNTIVTDVTGGNYQIVKSMVGQSILFHDLVFSGINYNNKNTLFRLNSSFNLVGTIGDEFFISLKQINQGSFGVPTTLRDFNADTPSVGTGRVFFAGNPDLSNVTVGSSSNYVLLDSDKNVFEITAVNNLTKTVDILHDATTTTAPNFNLGAGKPGSVAPRYYSDKSETSFVIGLANKESGIGFQATGSIVIASPTITATGANRVSNVVTITTTTSHPFIVGQTVEISGVTDASFNGSFVITAVPDSTSFTYAQAAGDATSGNGKASLTGINISDGTLLTLNDGTNPATVFEFDKDASVAGGNVAITITDLDNAATLRDAIITAIQGATLLAIAASDGAGLSGSDEVVFLLNDNIGTSGNQTIADTISVSGVSLDGMSGGLGSGHGIPTPVIPSSGESVNDFGISSDGTIVDHFEFRTSGFVDDIINLRNSEIPQISEADIELDSRGGVI